MPNKKVIAILASGSGSNAEVLVRKAQSLELGFAGIFCDQKNAVVFERAKKLGVPCHLIEALPQEKRVDYDKRLLALLTQHKVDWVFLAGFMRLLSPHFLRAFYDQHLKKSRVVNIHPSLLPAFPGKSGYEDAFTHGVKVSGVTVHFVDEGLDSGPIIAQKSFPRLPGDDLQSFKRRGLNLEHDLYPQVMAELLGGSEC